MEDISLRRFLKNYNFKKFQSSYPLIGLWINDYLSDNPKKNLVRILPYPDREDETFYVHEMDITVIGCNFSNFLKNKIIDFWENFEDQRIDILIDIETIVEDNYEEEVKQICLYDLDKPTLFDRIKSKFKRRKSNIDYWDRSGKNKEEISLREFVYRFVGPNTLIRVWVQNEDKTYTNLLIDDTNPNSYCYYMEHAIERGIGYAKYLNKRFVKVADILTDTYPKALNIVIDLDTDIL